MECRKFEINLISATDLENVRQILKMKVYARVSIGNDPTTEQRTPADRHGRANPAWNFTLRYTIGESLVQNNSGTLVIKLFCKRKLGDRYIGEVNLSMRELYEFGSHNGGSAVVNNPVQSGSVNSQGLLTLSYRFGEKVPVGSLLLDENIVVLHA